MNQFERARFEANVAAKAARLKAEGYIIEPDAACLDRWWVTRPTGETTYQVSTDGNGWCGCWLFAQHQLCHHLLAVQQAEEQRMWDQIAAEYDAHCTAENERWGCDPVEENWTMLSTTVR